MFSFSSDSKSASTRRKLFVEHLEDRLTPADLISKALDYGVLVDRSQVRGDALAVMNNTARGGLGSFPTGPNDSFLVLSTGDASKAYAPRGTYPVDGLDWGQSGSADDQQFLRLFVPMTGNKHLRFDLNFMTDEVPSPTNEFNDQFFILATPVDAQLNAGFSQTVAQMSVNDDLFLTTPPTNAIYARHTGCYTVDYEVPAGSLFVRLDIVLDDRPFTFGTNDHSGKGDSALLLDNFRYTQNQLVWLNFDGGTLNNYPVNNATTTFPAFQPADIRSSADRTTLISSIVTGIESKFAAYGIDFTTTQPAPGTGYSTMMIGGAGSNVINLGSGADPRLKQNYGATMTIQNAVGNVFGSSLIDYGNKSLTTPGFVLSKNFDLAQLYLGMDAPELERRLVVSICHEIAHTVGTPHVEDQFDDNIMAASSPRSQYGVFEDVRRKTTETLPDGRTELNINGYLSSVLGLASGSGFVNGPSMSTTGKFFKLNLGVNIFDVKFGLASGKPDSEPGVVQPEVLWQNYAALKAGENEIELADIAPDAHVIFYGSTTPGGPVDFFSGTPTAGTMSFADGFVKLVDANGIVQPTLAASTGQYGSMQPLPNGIGVTASPYSVPGLKPLPKKGLTFTDVDGDVVTVKLTSAKGTAMIQIDDPDGDGKGSIGQLTLQGTLPTDTLSVSVVKKPLLGGNGYVDIGKINGTTLLNLSAPKANLVGEGISFSGNVRSLSLKDVKNGADILLGGSFNTFTTFNVHDIGNDTDIQTGSRLTMTAARVGDGTLKTARLTQLLVKGDAVAGIRGDFRSDITVEPGRTLTNAEKAVPLLGTYRVTGQTIGSTISVPGNVTTFYTGTFENSSLLVGYTPTDTANPLAGGTWTGDFKITNLRMQGYNGYIGPTFVNSNVISAKVGNPYIKNLTDTNGGKKFGFAVKNGLLNNRGVITITTPLIKILPTTPAPFILNDFTVKLL